MHVKWWNNNKCLCDCKIYICENVMFEILVHVVVKMDNI